MTDRIEIIAKQGSTLSWPITLLEPGESLLGKAVRLQVRKAVGDTVVQLVASSTDERLTVTGARTMLLAIPSNVMAALLVIDPVETWSVDVFSYTNSEDAIEEARGTFKVYRATTRDTEIEPAPTVAGFVSATIPQAWSAEEQAIAQANIGVSPGGGGGGGTDDHGALQGLSDDDHPQYALADGSRGQFATAAQGALADTAVQPAAIATKLDDLSAGTADALVTASADGTLLSRAAYTIASLIAHVVSRAQHTGTQLASTISDFASAAIAAVTWSTLTGKPSTFDPSAHGHPASEITDSTSAGRAVLTAADAAAQRTTLGLGTAATQASSAFEAAGAISTHNAVTTAHGISAFGATLVDDADASAARTTLGLGTAATAATGAFEAAGAVSTHAALTTGAHGITAAGAALLDDANAAAQRTTLGLVIGTDVQAYDAELAAIAGLTSAADKGVMFSGVGTAATFDLTAAARTVLDDTTTAAMLTTLGAQAALVSGTNIKTINSTSLLGSGDIAISASPGGSTLQPQYNAAGSFAGMAGVSWDDTNRAETRTGATVTTSNPVQSFTQTWNAAGVTFTGWKLNVTNTASASGSLLADWQVGGVSQAKLRKDGWLFLADGAGIAGITATTTGIQVNYGGNNPDINIFTNSTERALFYGSGVAFSGSIQIGSAVKYGGDVFLSRNASGVAEFTNGSTGTFRDLKLRTLIASETVKLASYTVATVPSASTSGAGATIYVSDETGGAVVAFSDATNWRRVTDRAVIS